MRVLAHLPVRFFWISIVERANKIHMPSQGRLAIVDDAVVAPIENQNKDSISVFVPASSAQAHIVTTPPARSRRLRQARSPYVGHVPPNRLSPSRRISKADA